jgi:hypothetical protein
MEGLKLPYDKIEIGLHDTVQVSDFDVIFTFHGDELCIEREEESEDKAKGLPALPAIYLSFSEEDAVKLRDFLNFALPHTP